MKLIATLLSSPAMILRLGGGICFVGHGILALTGKAGFVGLLGSFGLDPAQAISLLKVIGSLDILVGLLILFKPNKLVLQWAIAWTTLTIVAWGIHGDSLMDLARRATYMTTPLALLIILYQREKSLRQIRDTGKGIEPSAPNSPLFVGDDNVPSLRIDIDLSMICMKLMDPQEGEGWNSRQCAEVSEEYRRFLVLHLLYPTENIVPNLAIDTIWHYHILDTAAYQRDCQMIFGKMLHHYPYFGMKGEEDAQQFVSAFDRTKILYEQTFGVPMGGPNYMPSFQVRRSA